MDKLEDLKKLKNLLDEGVITSDEYSKMKTDILSENKEDVIMSTPENKLNEQASQIKKKSSSPILIASVLVIVIFLIFKFTLRDKDSVNNSIDNTENSLLSKKEHLRTYNDWEQIANYRSQEFYDCAKDLISQDRWREVGDICSAEHRNKMVEFRDGLDNNANLNYDQREALKAYWDKMSDSTIEKIKVEIDQNELAKRPNRNNQ